jgi:cyclophilin family peptidyl-prolyl cis-trans isomerase
MNGKHLWPLFTVALLVLPARPSRADFTFTYNGHSYTVVTNAKTWDNAQADAVARGGVLARIEDAAENNALLTNLLGNGITNTAADGGGSIYVWIGGRETVEGTYVWTNRDRSAIAFWTGGKTGSAANGLYANWGRNAITGGGPEPDNYAGTQNRVGFALEAWPKSGTSKIGQAGQWNDLNGTDLLPYVVERTPPNAPSNVAITVTSPTSVALTWKDNSDDEWGFYVGYRVGVAGNWQLLAQRLPNETNQSVYGTAPGMTYQFLIKAYNDVGPADSSPATVTMPGISSRSFCPAVVGQPFSYTLTASSEGGTPDSFGLTGTLPPGLTYNATTHQITGTPTNAGVFTSTMSVHYPTWGSFTKPFTVRVIYPPGPPVAVVAVPKQTVITGGPGLTVALNDFFTDRDTEKAVRLVTSKGTFDLALYATATPQTVSNFLNYVVRGDYSNSVIHRAVPDFVVQGGGFKPAPPNFTAIPTDPSPTNEPGIQHVRGTVAMAKQGSNPNSATDQWFINLNDNSAQLDDQNGGFTAFGRLCGSGLTVADTVAALPRTNYTILVDGQSASFSDWPMDSTPPPPATMDQSKLVLVSSVKQIEPLTYAVTGNTNTGLVAAAISGTNLMLRPTGLFGGTSVVTVAATDLDGNSLSQSVTVQVVSAYSTWAGQTGLQGTNSLPSADPDGDGMPNGVEFALVGSPTNSDAAVTRSIGVFTSTGGQPYAALTFKLRKDLGGVLITVNASSTLASGGWAPIWTSNDLGSPLVAALVDQGDHWRITLRDSTPLSAGASQRFLRLVVNTP